LLSNYCFLNIRHHSLLFYMEPKESFINPIDKLKTTDTPGLLPYAHTVGGAIIRPIDKGRTTGLAMSAMYEQTGVQLNQLKEQVETLLRQAQTIHDRIRISELIYKADAGFKPRILQLYHLYERKTTGKYVLSMVAPNEWGRSQPFIFVASVRLLSDHTWDVLVTEGKSPFMT
jgi:hypothetical protein